MEVTLHHYDSVSLTQMGRLSELATLALAIAARVIDEILQIALD